MKELLITSDVQVSWYYAPIMPQQILALGDACIGRDRMRNDASGAETIHSPAQDTDPHAREEPPI